MFGNSSRTLNVDSLNLVWPCVILRVWQGCWLLESEFRRLHGLDLSMLRSGTPSSKKHLRTTQNLLANKIHQSSVTTTWALPNKQIQKYNNPKMYEKCINMIKHVQYYTTPFLVDMCGRTFDFTMFRSLCNWGHIEFAWVSFWEALMFNMHALHFGLRLQWEKDGKGLLTYTVHYFYWSWRMVRRWRYSLDVLQLEYSTNM